MDHALRSNVCRLSTALLILMSLLSVFPVDVILPSFPALSETFGVAGKDIAYSMSAFAVAVAFSQCFIGPLSDRVGRQKLLLAGLLIAMAGAIGCTIAPNYAVFMVFRAIQAIGCGCFVLCQALVQDLYPAHRRNAMRILLTTTSGLFISISPLAGTVLQHLWGWPGSFHVFVGLCVLGIVLVYAMPAERRSEPSAQGSVRNYGVLLRDAAFVLYSLIAALAFTCHFTFVVVSPLLFIDRLGFSAEAFAWVFVVYGMAYLLGGLFAARVNRLLRPQVQIALGLALIAAAGVIMLGTLWLGGLSAFALLLPMIICTAGTTVARPAAMSCALERHPGCAGTAAALSSTLLFMLGGVLSGLIAVAEHGLPERLALALIAVGLCAGLMLKAISVASKRRRVT
ncbi:MFS transporter [Pseudomonas cremoricolorata]|uniref:MFS transporter n=1 Tax=Pseudomonas cremoricolorata TaxID=157783 RepID=UPI000407EFCC|nr:MFS transporter [Pseudomonas cremoricolorata]